MQPTTSTHLDVPTPNGNQTLLWQSAHAWLAPRRLVLATDTLSTEDAYRAVSQGTALLWQGDFQQARQMLAAIKRRLNNKARSFESVTWPERFHRIRLQRSQAARQAGLLLIQVKPGYVIDLARSVAPQTLYEAMQMAYGTRLEGESFVLPLSELTGVLSAHEWHRKGLPVATLGGKLYPRWGVFAPTRHEYLDLVAQAVLPRPCEQAVDVGTGTGVLAMLLAKRGVRQILATDTNPAALACAKDNITRANLSSQINVQDTDLIPAGTFELLVCNPPWLPGVASGPLEAAVYDPQHRMLRGFLSKTAAHLKPNGQAWLILSDLAERLQLRSRDDLLTWISQAGLVIINRLDTRPTHRKLLDTSDPLAALRRAEITSLWQLQKASSSA